MSVWKRIGEDAELEETRRQKRCFTGAEWEHTLHASNGTYLFINAELHRIHVERDFRNQCSPLSNDVSDSEVDDESSELNRKQKRQMTMLDLNHEGNTSAGTYLRANALLHQLHSGRLAMDELSNSPWVQLEDGECCQEGSGQKRDLWEFAMDIPVPDEDSDTSL